MARAKNTLTQRIALEGGSEVRKELLEMGKAGGTAFDSLQRHVRDLEKATVGFNGRLLELRNRVDNVGSAFQKLGSRFGFINTEIGRIAGTIAGAFTVRALADMTSQWTDLTSRVRLAIPEQENVDEVMKRLTQTARGTYSSLQLTIEGFAENASVLRELGLSTQQQLDFQEALNNALVVSGARGDRARQVTDALTKSMAIGALRGEYLNSVLRAGGRVTELLAEHFGVTRGELLKLGQEGKITAEVIQDVLLNNMQTLRDEAASMPATIADGFQLIQNALLAYVGTADQATGTSAMIAEGLIWIADNIDLVVNAALLMAGAFAAVKAVGLAADLIGIARALVMLVPALVSVGAALLANPMTLWAVAITGAAVAILALTGNLDNFISAVGAVIGPIYDAMSAMLGFGEESDESLDNANDKTNQLEQTSGSLADRLVKVAETSAESGDALGTMGEEGVEAGDSITASIESTTNSIVELTAAVDSAISSFVELAKAKAAAGEGGGEGGEPGFSGGGAVHGAGTSTSDSILARLSDGEFVMRAAAVRKFGVGFMKRLNSLHTPGFAAGGLVEGLTSRMNLSPTIAYPDSMMSSGVSGRPLTLNIGGESFSGLIAPDDVAERLTKYALGRQVRSAGRKPNWYGGQ